MISRPPCPKCKNKVVFAIEEVTWQLPFYEKMTELTWVERCIKCRWNMPHNLTLDDNKCPICRVKFGEDGRCKVCGRIVFDFAVRTTTTRDFLSDVLCENCINESKCEYVCSALLSIIRMIRRGQITKIQKYAGIPYYHDELHIKRAKHNIIDVPPP